MVTIIWTDLAIQDLKSIHDYIALDSKFYAKRFVAKLILRVDQLEVSPNLGRMVPEFNNISIRELIDGNYRLIYKVETKSITILRFHNSAKLLKSV